MPEQSGRLLTVPAVIGVAVVALGLVLTPGPMIYLVSRSITQGRLAGLVSLLGVAVGFGVYLAATTAGMTAIFAAVPTAHPADPSPRHPLRTGPGGVTIPTSSANPTSRPASEGWFLGEAVVGVGLGVGV